jgi:hypothetical protein
MSRKTDKRVEKARENIEAFTNKKQSDHENFIDRRIGFKMKPLAYMIKFIYSPKRAY